MSPHRIPWSSIAALIIALGCDRATAPVPATVTSASPQATLAASTQQSFDLTISSSRNGDAAFVHVLHVKRQKTGKGWRTSVAVEPSGLLTGLPAARTEIAGIEIDEDGNRVLSTRGGRTIKVGKGKLSVKEDANGMSVSSTESAISVAAGPATTPFDLLGAALFSKTESATRVAAVSRRDGVARNGRLVRLQSAADGNTEIEYDAISGLMLLAKGHAPNGGTFTVEHRYQASGNFLVRTSTTNTLIGPRSPVVSSLRLSHIAIDGKEIAQ